uniref:Uncharacterized protein n=1 Tax=Onchocerca volvulus TaxID=6282 RepID=A0A8R1Y192_ONCVO
MMKTSTTERTAAAAATAKVNQKKHVRTCCNCWHIKFGTIVLGLMELVAVALILSGFIAQIINKSREINCDQEITFRYRMHIF